MMTYLLCIYCCHLCSLISVVICYLFRRRDLLRNEEKDLENLSNITSVAFVLTFHGHCVVVPWIPSASKLTQNHR